jgi:hypothetical protein
VTSETISSKHIERRLLADQVQGAKIKVLNALEILGVVSVAPARINWQTKLVGMSELYSDLPCPAPPSPPPQPSPVLYTFVPVREHLNRTLLLLALHLISMSKTLSTIGIDMVPWKGLARFADPDRFLEKGSNHIPGIDLLMEDDGYLGIYETEFSDEVIWGKNAKRISRLATLLSGLYGVLDRIDQTVGHGAVAARLQVEVGDHKITVIFNNDSYDVTVVAHADVVFDLLRKADGDYVPSQLINEAAGIGQFKPQEFKKRIAKVSRRLANLIGCSKSKGSRLVLTLPTQQVSSSHV